MILNLIYIWIIVVIIIDISGFIDTLKLQLSKFLTKGKIPTTDFRIPPFDCSFCANWWVSLIYIICMEQFSLGLCAFILFLSTLIPVLKEFIFLIQDISIKILQKINNIL